MTIGKYIETIYGTGLFGKNKAKFGTTLFQVAGSHEEVSEEAIKSYIYGRNKCPVEKHFPDDVIDETEFIKYFRRKARGSDSLKRLQNAFRILKTDDSVDEDFCVDLKTEDPNVFYWSLLNQFQRVLRLPESEREESNSTVPVTVPYQIELSSEQIRDKFLEAANYYEIMDIINREPPIWNRDDSACLNTFLNEIDVLMNCSPKSSPLYAPLECFIDALQQQVLSLDATLNINFTSAEKNAAVNMEGDEDLAANTENITRRLGIPELSIDLIADAADPTKLLKIAVEDWENFRSKMNLLFKEISSYRNKK